MKYKKLLKLDIKKLVGEIKNSVIKLSPIKNDSYKHNQKYTIDEYILGIIDVCKNYSSWNSYTGFINGNTLRKKHNEWCKLNIYDDVYKNFLNKFLNKNTKTKEFKYQSIDSTFIRDKNGSKCSSYNRNYKNEKNKTSKGIKITTLVTTKGIPLAITLDKGNKYDSTLLNKNINNKMINTNTKKYSKNNRYKQYFLADKGYDSKENIMKLDKLGYVPIIPQNRRNIKNKKLIRKLNNKQKGILKKRVIVENFFSWIKKFQKIKYLYERSIKNYNGLLLLTISIITFKRL
jgi:transposase